MLTFLIMTLVMPLMPSACAAAVPIVTAPPAARNNTQVTQTIKRNLGFKAIKLQENGIAKSLHEPQKIGRQDFVARLLYINL